MSGPPEYDPRRLFPFGLSPIPEVPSELASEVSSMYSYNPDDEDGSEADTEIEGAKTPGSIMYSGSCSSVKSNGTLEDKAQAIDSSDADTSDEESTEEEDESDEGGDKVIIEARPIHVVEEKQITSSTIVQETSSMTTLRSLIEEEVETRVETKLDISKEINTTVVDEVSW
jgi:hypothetical protein